MQFRYEDDHEYSKIYCFNYEEALEKIKNGQIFRRNNLGFYYRLSKANVKTNSSIPENVILLEAVCVTSSTTKRTGLYQLIRSENPNDTLFFDKELNKFILKELFLWGRTMNTEKLTGFGSRRFKSYLMAIPYEVVSQPQFLKSAKKALSNGFKNREFKIEEAGIITDLAIKNLEKRRNTETANKEEANKKVAKLLKELG